MHLKIYFISSDTYRNKVILEMSVKVYERFYVKYIIKQCTGNIIYLSSDLTMPHYYTWSHIIILGSLDMPPCCNSSSINNMGNNKTYLESQNIAFPNKNKKINGNYYGKYQLIVSRYISNEKKKIELFYFQLYLLNLK